MATSAPVQPTVVARDHQPLLKDNNSKTSRQASGASTPTLVKVSSSNSDSPTPVLITNASETGYEHYDDMAQHQSLDYHTVHNELLRTELFKLKQRDYIIDNIQRWLVTCVVGLAIGVIGFALHYGIDNVSKYKFQFVSQYLQSDIVGVAPPWMLGFLLFTIINVALVTVGSVLIIFVVPAANGSGIPEVKGFLNGTAISRAMNVKTFVVKFISAVGAVASSLPVGPEGPMIHMGAMVGGGVSQPRSKTLKITIPCTQRFHTDRDRRDFIAMGAAAGVASAFGAPLGGVLFAIEEASSFWSPVLTWRTFFACMIATFSTNFLLSGIMGNWGSYDGSSVIVFDVGSTAAEEYRLWELLPFALMGMFSGLTGALFNVLSERMVLFRERYIVKHSMRRLLEIIFLMIVVSAVMFFMPFYFNCRQCIAPPSKPNCVGAECCLNDGSDDDAINDVVSFMCPVGQYNDMATLFFTSQSGAVRHLLSRSTRHEFSVVALIIFYLTFFILAMYSSGAAVAGGLLVPLLLIGASYGRLVGNLMLYCGVTIDPGTYALIGAASFFSGVTRMTVSLSIIMLEITNDLHYLPAIMLTVMCAKWIGDLITIPLYETMMEIKHYPYLDPDPPIQMDLLVSSDIMATNPKVITETPRVSDVIALLKSCDHAGFPVVSSRPVHTSRMNNPSAQFYKSFTPPQSQNNLDALRSNTETNHHDHADGLHTHSNGTVHSTQNSMPHPPLQLNSTHPLPHSHGHSHAHPHQRHRQLTAGSSSTLGAGSGRVLRGLILRRQLIVLPYTTLLDAEPLPTDSGGLSL